MKKKRQLITTIIGTISLYSLACASTPAGRLHDGALYGDIPKMEAAVKEGANPKEVDPNGTTPLRAAAMFGKVDAIEWLCKRGANPNIAEKQTQMTPLMYAANRGDEKAVDLLLKCGADKSETNRKGYTAGQIALIRGHTNLARKLGANVPADAASSDDEAVNSAFEALQGTQMNESAAPRKKRR